MAKASLQGRLEPSAELASDAAGDVQLHVGQQQLWALLFSPLELAQLVLVLVLWELVLELVLWGLVLELVLLGLQ